MTRICLDTSAYSHLKRGDPEVVEVVRRARDVGVPVIVLGELRAGFLCGERAVENERDLHRFLAQSVIRVLEVDEGASQQYAEIMAELRRDGTPVPTNDVWIAALAAREGATVVTYDDHYTRIRRVGCRVLARGA